MVRHLVSLVVKLWTRGFDAEALVYITAWIYDISNLQRALHVFRASRGVCGSSNPNFGSDCPSN
jgi:hypothetical protein